MAFAMYFSGTVGEERNKERKKEVKVVLRNIYLIAAGWLQ